MKGYSRVVWCGAVDGVAAVATVRGLVVLYVRSAGTTSLRQKL